MKFAMGAETLTALTKNTSSAGDDLSTLVKQLSAAAEPLEGKFQGAGRSAFDNFKARTDEIAVELKSSLNAVLEGVSGMDKSFLQGDQTIAEQTKSAESGSSFDSARFSGKA